MEKLDQKYDNKQQKGEVDAMTNKLKGLLYFTTLRVELLTLQLYLLRTGIEGSIIGQSVISMTIND